MEREDEDAIMSMPEVSENVDNQSGSPETNPTVSNTIVAKDLANVNKHKDEVASAIGSGESCSHSYLEHEVVESVLESGDSEELVKNSTDDITDKNQSKEGKLIPKSSDMFKNDSNEAVKNLKETSLELSEKNVENVVSECGPSKRTIAQDQEDGDNRISMDESKNSLDPDSGKRQRTDETTNGSVEENSEDESRPKFHKLKSKVRKRNYRVKQTRHETPDNSDDRVASVSNNKETETTSTDRGQSSSSTANEDSNPGADSLAADDIVEHLRELLGENSETRGADQEKDDDDSNEWTSASDEDSYEPVLPALSKEKPKPQWFVIPEVINRQLGSNRLFQRRFYGSLHTVQRLELMYKLKEHKGCVNTLSFNQRGNLLASGSDDLKVVIWNWPRGKKHHVFDTGHRSNVFQASWLPLPSESLMVTCARDGQVRLADLHKSSVHCTRRLATHEGPATKLTIHPDVPHVILSAGEDAKVLAIDVRQSKPSTLLTVKEGHSSVAIYSINSNPLNSNEFCLGGRDQYVRVYDKRKVSSPLYTRCPKHLKTTENHAHVTCAVYNYNGSEILASYNDEDIYLFDTLQPFPSGDFEHRYQGHRNNATVKGVNFFGPKSEFVISGSDCGNIYIWEKNTEAIVQWMAGDEYGVVNRLEPHPHVPVLATSGLDYDVKIWVPSCEEPPSMKNLETCVRYNMRNREREISREPDVFDGEMLCFLWRHITESEGPRGRQRHRRRRFRDHEEDADTSSDDTSNHSNSHSDDESDERPQCSPS